MCQKWTAELDASVEDANMSTAVLKRPQVSQNTPSSLC